MTNLIRKINNAKNFEELTEIVHKGCLEEFGYEVTESWDEEICTLSCDETLSAQEIEKNKGPVAILQLGSNKWDQLS